MESANRKCGSFGSLAIILSGILHFVCTFTKKFNTFNQTIWTVLLAFFKIYFDAPLRNCFAAVCLSLSWSIQQRFPFILIAGDAYIEMKFVIQVIIIIST